MTDSSHPGVRSDRGSVISDALFRLAKSSACLIAIAAGAWLIAWSVGKFWVIVLPVVLAIVVATVLWPPTRLLRRAGLPAAAAAAVSLLGLVAILAAVIGLIVPAVVDQTPQLADQAIAGVNKVEDWLQGPPLNIREEQLSSAVDAIVSKLQASAASIASGVFTGVTTATSMLVTLFLVLMLSFFFVKDGPRFLPWLRGIADPRSGGHLEVVLTRMWGTLGGFVRTQALVSLIDAVFIGAGLMILHVPLAFVLAVMTFLGGFVPIVGAFVAGALAVLVALVANGLTTALIVLGLIIVVQQIEGNVLQPMLQSKSMNLHPVVVLLAVTAGSSLFGIIGAFLAVPVAAVAAVLLRYLGEQVDLLSPPTESAPPSPPSAADSDDPAAPAGNPDDPGSRAGDSGSAAAARPGD